MKFPPTVHVKDYKFHRPLYSSAKCPTIDEENMNYLFERKNYWNWQGFSYEGNKF